MDTKTDLHRYLPKIYKGFVETDALMSAENMLFDDLKKPAEIIFIDQFINTANSNGLKRFENIFGIESDPDESIDFRRRRIIARFSHSPPFTTVYLRDVIARLLGTSNFVLSTDYNEYIIRLECRAEDKFYFHEINVSAAKLKPSNMRFIFCPRISSEIDLNETVTNTRRQWNYRVGVSAVASETKPLADFFEMGVIKMAESKSIQEQFIKNLIFSTAKSIKKVLINGIYEITDLSFIYPNSDENNATTRTLELEYTVPYDCGQSEITSIKLLGKSGTTLSDCSVYVPLNDDAIIKHSLLIAGNK